MVGTCHLRILQGKVWGQRWVAWKLLWQTQYQISTTHQDVAQTRMIKNITNKSQQCENVRLHYQKKMCVNDGLEITPNRTFEWWCCRSPQQWHSRHHRGLSSRRFSRSHRRKGALPARVQRAWIIERWSGPKWEITYIAFVVEWVENLFDLLSWMTFCKLSIGEFEEFSKIQTIGMFSVEWVHDVVD